MRFLENNIITLLFIIVVSGFIFSLLYNVSSKNKKLKTIIFIPFNFLKKFKERLK